MSIPEAKAEQEMSMKHIDKVVDIEETKREIKAHIASKKNIPKIDLAHV